MGSVFHTLKKIIMRMRLPGSGRLMKIISFFQIGTFLRGDLKNRFSDRYLLYEYLNNTFIKDNPVSYLEFGVYKGDSIRYWASINKNEVSEFIGFDTFEGLPERWIKVTGHLDKGEFSAKSALPQIDDCRIRFVKGLFQDVLNDFLRSFTDNKQKVIHLDADLYSSTLYVLTKMDDHINKGDIIIFDEFTSGDEYLAFVNYIGAYRREYQIIGVSGESYQQVAIKII